MDNPWTDAWPEADLAAPSWSAGVGVRWAEPSDAWNTSSAQPSPYDDIPLGRSQSSPVEEHPDSVDFQTAPTTPAPQKQLSLPPSPTHPPSTRRGSPYEFNTFETADVNVSFPQDSFAWPAAQPWSPPPDSQDQPRVDEWELAKLQKEKLDYHVPPELLASILEQLKELSTDLWPELEDGETRQPSKDFLTDVPGLKQVVDRLVPDDLVLSANVQFSRTFTSKHMNEALRLTRHLPITLSSPLSIYMASKGSTAWETFVRSKQDMGQDEILPPGWRMVGKTAREPTPTPEVKKKTGGLLSFLGLKSGDTTATTTEPQKLSPSSSRPASIVENIKSPKSSLDGIFNPDPERRSSISQPSATNTSTFTSNSSPTSQSSASSPNTEQGTAPSAVSRFFGRFSRSSTASSNSSRSFALSSDDIDFLGDIAPSAQDDVDDDENLRNVISAKSPSSLSATPLPQPLPPPPKFSRPGPGSSLQADSPFSLFDTLADEQSLTAAEAKSIQSLVPTVPSTNLSTSWQMPTPPIALNLRRKNSPQRRNFTAVMTGSGRSAPSNLQTALPPPPLPPPPLTQLPVINPPQSQPRKQSTSLFDDDEFSAFMSPPAKAGPTRPPLVQPPSAPLIGSPPSIRSFPKIPSEHHSSHHRKNSSKNSNHNLLDDEFDEFVSSPMTPTLRTPTPPRPPSKIPGHISPPPPPQGLRSTKNRDSLPPPPPPPPQKASRAAAHARTLSLLETAAARPGRWPAPPSPLPEAIAPPPSTSSKGPPLNVFDNGEGEVVQLSQTLTGGKKPQTQTLLAASNTLWNATGPNSGTTLPLRAMSPQQLVPSKVNGAAMVAPTAPSNPSLWSLGANSGGKPLTPSPGSRNKPTSGLSAQDLSFFEGL